MATELFDVTADVVAEAQQTITDTLKTVKVRFLFTAYLFVRSLHSRAHRW